MISQLIYITSGITTISMVFYLFQLLSEAIKTIP